MTRIVQSIFALLLGVVLLMLGNGPLGTVIAVRLSGTTDAVVIGFVMAGYFAGLTLGSLCGHLFIVRVGHIRAFSAFASTISAATLMHAVDGHIVLWAALRLVEGFCMAGLFICIESWLNDRATPQTRGQILAFYMICVYVGQGISQFLLNLEDQSGFLVFVVISILLSLALVPVALTRMPPPTLPKISSFSFRKLYRTSPLGVAGTLISGLVSGAFYGVGPVFVQRLELGVSATALFMSATILGGVVLQWPLGRLSDLFDRRVMIAALCGALVVTSLAMLMVVDRGLPLLLTIALLFGGVIFTLYPLCVAHTNDYIDATDFVSASGGLILAYSIGATLGPIGASVAMSAWGPGGLFHFTAAIGLAALIFTLWRMTRRPSLPNEAQSPYQPLPRTTPVALPLDPRGDDGQLSFDFVPQDAH